MAKSTTTVDKRFRLSKNWFLAGANPQNYEWSLDESESHLGSTQSALITNRNARGKRSEWCTLMQQMRASKYRGKRLKMVMWVKSSDVKGWVAPWMRVDSSEQSSTSFDDCCVRQLRGTNDWTEYTVILDVAEDSSNIAYGVMLGGTGKLWMGDVSFEIVDGTEAVTDCPCFQKRNSKQSAVSNESPKAMSMPKGWTSDTKNERGQTSVFSAGVDLDEKFKNKNVSCVNVIEASGGALTGMYQSLRCSGYRGKRVRLTVQLKCADVQVAAGFLVEVKGPHEATLAYDDMSNRSLKGTHDWRKYGLVIDIPDDAVELKFGAHVRGVGKIWFADVTFEEVSREVLRTDNYSEGCRGIWWTNPINLDFSQDEESIYAYSPGAVFDVPKGWLCYSAPEDAYEVGADGTKMEKKRRLGGIKANGKREDADYALLFQKFDGKVYRGKRVRFSASVKTVGVTGSCGLALWVLDSHQLELFREDTFALDSAEEHGWAKREIVVQVPQHAGVLLISLELFGDGAAWMDDLKFDVVDDHVPLTKSEWKFLPRNLDFSQV